MDYYYRGFKQDILLKSFVYWFKLFINASIFKYIFRIDTV